MLFWIWLIMMVCVQGLFSQITVHKHFHAFISDTIN